MSRALKTRPAKRVSHASLSEAVLASRNSAWTIRRVGGIQIVECNQLAKLPWLTHGFSTGPGGASRVDGKSVLNLGFTDWDERKRVEANRSKFQATIAARKMPLVAMRQIHSDAIHLVPGPLAQAPCGDALVTQTPNLLLGVQTADCVPILLADARRHVVAA
ncbi:MAG: laccase domain-containing protein, partial [Bryobacteraceae bacterium]